MMSVRLSVSVDLSHQSIKFKLYIYTAPIKVRLLTGAPIKSLDSITGRMRAQTRQFSTIA